MDQHLPLAIDLGIILVLLAGIAMFRTPRWARRGNVTAAVALGLAALAVLTRNQIHQGEIIVAVLVAGAAAGWAVAARVTMIQIPAMVAFQHGAGGVAAFLVSFVELTRCTSAGLDIGKASGLVGLVLGAATFSGSLVAGGKLVGRLRSTPLVLPGHGLLADVQGHEPQPAQRVPRVSTRPESLLELGSKEMNMPAEIEFAVNLDVPEDEPRSFKFLQIRPIEEEQESEDVSVEGIAKAETIITSHTAPGDGLYRGLRDFVYVKPDAFDPSSTEEIICKIDAVNRRLQSEGRNYILVGPGRWGTADPWLGIPVEWANISGARVIVEASLKDYRMDASQGSHFFQNLTMFHVAYLTINPSVNDGTCDVKYLDALPASYEDAFLRHLRFCSPAMVRIDGRQSGDSIKAVILKPDK